MPGFFENPLLYAVLLISIGIAVGIAVPVSFYIIFFLSKRKKRLTDKIIKAVQHEARKKINTAMAGSKRLEAPINLDVFGIKIRAHPEDSADAVYVKWAKKYYKLISVCNT